MPLVESNSEPLSTQVDFSERKRLDSSCHSAHNEVILRRTTRQQRPLIRLIDYEVQTNQRTVNSCFMMEDTFENEPLSFYIATSVKPE